MIFNKSDYIFLCFILNNFKTAANLSTKHSRLYAASNSSNIIARSGALIMGLMGPIPGKLFDKYSIRVLAIVGLVITSYATYEFTKHTGETPYSHILGIYILRSFGMSLIMMPIMTAGMNQLPQHLISHGTALSNTIRQVAGSIGTAILVTIMTQQTTEHLSNYTNTLTSNNDFFSRQLSQLGTSGIMSLYAKAIKTSTIDGINNAFLFARLLGLVALLLSFFLRTPKINREK
nr:MFS transporter [Priestia megaterium]